MGGGAGGGVEHLPDIYVSVCLQMSAIDPKV